MRFKRVFVIVLDSLGIGPMADSARFDDAYDYWEENYGK